MSYSRIIGIDYGDARVGVAVTDPLGFTAQGISTLPNKVYEKMLEKLLEIIKQYDAKKIVIGYPKNMDGTRGERCDVTDAFAEDIRKNIPDAEIVLWDERLTTVQAAGILNCTNTRGASRKSVIDTVSACLILESYLNSQKN